MLDIHCICEAIKQSKPGMSYQFDFKKLKENMQFLAN